MKNRKKKAGSRNYYGEIRLRLESVENFTQVDSLCRDLEATGCLEIVARTWSERKGLEVFIFLKDPVPLGDRLRQITLVEEVYMTKKRVITVVLNNTIGGTISPFISTSDEGVFV